MLQTELEEWEKVEDDLAAKYAVEWGNLRAQYANMGLLNSGAYQSALASLQQKYSAANKERSDNIKSINAQIEELDAEKENPHPVMVLLQLSENYSLAIEDAVDKYNRYIAVEQ